MVILRACEGLSVRFAFSVTVSNLEPSDMSNLEFRGPINIDQRGMLYERVPLTLQMSYAGHRYRAQMVPPLELPRVGRAGQLSRVG